MPNIILNMNRRHAKDLILSLGNLESPVITNYQLALLIWRLKLVGEYNGQHLLIKRARPEKRDYIQLVDWLLEIGIIEDNKDFPKSSVFNLLGKDGSLAEETACSVDPFAYLSHLSAMSYHGLTDRIPQVLILSSPSPANWREFALQLMARDLNRELPDYRAANLPRLVRINMRKIGHKTVERYSSLHLGAYRSIRKKATRVSTIGRTFLDMLRAPDLCGGIHHVLDVFGNHAGRYKELIIDEIDRHGKPVDKVRAGYVLEEVCELRSDTIDGWLQFVQRGGSRRLDPGEEYSSTYSARWCLSINIE